LANHIELKFWRSHGTFLQECSPLQCADVAIANLAGRLSWPQSFGDLKSLSFIEVDINIVQVYLLIAGLQLFQENQSQIPEITLAITVAMEVIIAQQYFLPTLTNLLASDHAVTRREHAITLLLMPVHP
jgi:hypothetical protein